MLSLYKQPIRLLVRFSTKIFHPNINKYGEICIPKYHRECSPAMTIKKMLKRDPCTVDRSNVR